MPQDSIRLWIQNEESFYNDVNGLYDTWIEMGDAWDEKTARKEASALIAHIAEAIESKPFMRGERYSADDRQDAVDELMDDFKNYRDEAIEYTVKKAQEKPKPEDFTMDERDKDHAKKYEALAQKLGIEDLKKLIPVSPEKIRAALEKGDKHLNSIKLRKWDAAGMAIRGQGLSMAEKVCVLKHVAKWHYA